VQASPPPVGPITWRWSGTNRLVIQALAERPSWTARAQRLQFLAGVVRRGTRHSGCPHLGRPASRMGRPAPAP
jgi:hypothetical protein